MRMQQIPDASALTAWRKSSYSNGEGAECVEVADGLIGIVPVRDSKNPHGAALAFSAGQWSSFVCAVRRGEFPA
ncbi:DUF397 domain-containing protein [Streptomyces sp. NPDC058603]|uniref:DUF397 domain-containing protein n=1 Tax=Streptomyces sp. NPDC058603 TaxID=3346551 RepID=UPI003669FDBC